jgi:hypothetical protein
MNEPSWQVSLSAALDGELDASETQELLDAMAASPECRNQWQQIRAFDRNLETMRRPASGRLRSPSPVSRRPLAWLVPIAAVLALLGVGLLRPERAPIPDLQDPTAESLTVRLEGHRGQMTDLRFVQLVVEVLEADQRYQDKMRQVLEEVRPAASLAEAGSPESGTGRTEPLALAHRDDSTKRPGELPFEAVAGIH